MITNDTYKQVIRHYGPTAQLKKTIEELEELKEEIKDLLNDGGDRDKMLEELADVYNMIRQLQIIMRFDDIDINRVATEKMNRTQLRIQDELERVINIQTAILNKIT